MQVIAPIKRSFEECRFADDDVGSLDFSQIKPSLREKILMKKIMCL